jgi:cytochrome c553
MSKAGRALAILCGSIVGAVVLMFGIFWGVTRSKLNTTYAIPPIHFKAPAPTPELAERGRRLSIMHACSHCHGTDLGGTVLEHGALLGSIVPPNLTNGPAGIGRRLTDDDWARSIRHAVNRQNKPLLLMPGEHSYTDMTDEDLGALVVFARSLPPVDHHLPATSLRPGGHALVAMGMLPIYTPSIDHSVKPYVAQPGVTVGNGRYLAQMCQSCHGKTFEGIPPGFGLPPGPNLTSGGPLKSWSEADFVGFINTGKTPEGRQILSAVMPWKAFRLMRDDEIRSLWAYLRSLPPSTRNTTTTAAPAAPGGKQAHS